MLKFNFSNQYFIYNVDSYRANKTVWSLSFRQVFLIFVKFKKTLHVGLKNGCNYPSAEYSSYMLLCFSKKLPIKNNKTVCRSWSPTQTRKYEKKNLNIFLKKRREWKLDILVSGRSKRRVKSQSYSCHRRAVIRWRRRRRWRRGGLLRHSRLPLFPSLHSMCQNREGKNTRYKLGNTFSMYFSMLFSNVSPKRTSTNWKNDF